MISSPPAIADLLFILRQRPGNDKREESLAPSGPFEAELPGGGPTQTLTLARYDLIGDLQLRLVRETPGYRMALHMSELEESGLTADEAVSLALTNVHRRWGAPSAQPWHNLQRVTGTSADEASCYFVDRAFWRARLAAHPEGVVVAAPRTDTLLFAPAVDTAAVDSMRRGIPGLHAAADNVLLSPALYLFKDDRWSVLQA